MSIYYKVGLPVNSSFALVLGNLFKIHPTFDDMVVRLIARWHFRNVANSDDFHVVFIAEKVVETNEMLFERIKLRVSLLQSPETGNSVTDGDIAAMMSRILFASYDHYFNLIMHAAVVLDTFPYGGCLTAHDALSNGVPTITLPSEFLRGRFTAAIYKQMGVTNLIAKNVEDYLSLVNHLMANAEERASLSAKLKYSFHNVFHKNGAVAFEWVSFIMRLFRSVAS
jgi:hypothetical protein